MLQTTSYSQCYSIPSTCLIHAWSAVWSFSAERPPVYLFFVFLGLYMRLSDVDIVAVAAILDCLSSDRYSLLIWSDLTSHDTRGFVNHCGPCHHKVVFCGILDSISLEIRSAGLSWDATCLQSPPFVYSCTSATWLATDVFHFVAGADSHDKTIVESVHRYMLSIHKLRIDCRPYVLVWPVTKSHITLVEVRLFSMLENSLFCTQ
jgi:hypothetical protein